MNTSAIARVASRTPSGAPDASPTQGYLLHELLTAMAAAIPATGTRKLTPAEIGEVLKLKGNDLARFIPLVAEASIASGGKVTLVLRDEFRFRPVPEARELLLRMVFRGTASPGKLVIDEGLAAVIAFIKTNIKSMEDATEENAAGVRVIAGLGTEFYPI